MKEEYRMKKFEFYNAISKKEYEKAETLFIELCEINKNDVIELHFIYNEAIDMYYKQRDNGELFIEKCIEICNKDISMLPSFKKEWILKETKEVLSLIEHSKENGEDTSLLMKSLPITEIEIRIPSFERLEIIYKKRGEYEKAIEICREALKYKQVSIEYLEKLIKKKDSENLKKNKNNEIELALNEMILEVNNIAKKYILIDRIYTKNEGKIVLFYIDNNPMKWFCKLSKVSSSFKIVFPEFHNVEKDGESFIFKNSVEMLIFKEKIRIFLSKVVI